MLLVACRLAKTMTILLLVGGFRGCAAQWYGDWSTTKDGLCHSVQRLDNSASKWRYGTSSRVMVIVDIIPIFWIWSCFERIRIIRLHFNWFLWRGEMHYWYTAAVDLLVVALWHVLVWIQAVDNLRWCQNGAGDNIFPGGRIRVLEWSFFSSLQTWCRHDKYYYQYCTIEQVELALNSRQE